MPADFAPWVGRTLPDEIDGAAGDPVDDINNAASIAAGYAAYNDGRFVQANYTQRVLQTLFQPYGEQYVNLSGVDTVSLDMYWYTIPDTSFGNEYVSAVNDPVSPRRASSYGAMVSGMNQLDATDGDLRPKWMIVEMLSGSPGEQFVGYVTPSQLKGAAINSIIHEARGLIWFNNVASEGYGVGNVLRAAQVDGVSFAGYSQVEAMGEVNAQVKALAPVINTQSYDWDFGTGFDTMLKAYNGNAYIFSMISNDSNPGSRTFTLPEGINGTQVEVVDENRSIAITNGTFTDNFVDEASYHIYKIAL